MGSNFLLDLNSSQQRRYGFKPSSMCRQFFFFRRLWQDRVEDELPYLRFPEDEGTTIPRNVGKYSPNHTQS